MKSSHNMARAITLIFDYTFVNFWLKQFSKLALGKIYVYNYCYGTRNNFHICFSFSFYSFSWDFKCRELKYSWHTIIFNLYKATLFISPIRSWSPFPFPLQTTSIIYLNTFPWKYSQSFKVLALLCVYIWCDKL